MPEALLGAAPKPDVKKASAAVEEKETVSA